MAEGVPVLGVRCVVGCGLLLAWGWCARPAGAATSAVARVQGPASTPQEVVDIRADKLVYDRETGWAEGTGHVIVLKGEDRLTADYVRVNMATDEAEAFGNVVLTRPSGVTKGERLSYNFGTRQGSAEDLSGLAAPFYWVAQSADRVSTNAYVLHHAEVTTCCFKGRRRHFHVRAKEITLVPQESMKARHAVWYFGRVPALYLPYWFRSLKESGCGWSFQPGYDSRMGAYLLSAYSCSLWPWLKTETHLDYRTRRGVGLGQDFMWHQPGSSWSGDLELYGLDDKKPVNPDSEIYRGEIDSARHRVRLRHRYYPDAQNYALLQAYHLSDPYVQEDFFEREYQRESQPENYFVFTHRGENYLAQFQVRKRLNDFYTTLERLPEVSADLFRQEIGDSRFYYEGHGSLGYLQKLWEDDLALEDYAAVRGDTYHRVYRPYKLFGFLNMVPRAGYQGTWYSETVEDGAAAGSGLRSLFELGHEVSFKAFRVWRGGGASGSAYRHIVEPYADYQFVQNDGLEPADIRPFDQVDGLGQEHWVQLGVRNKLQTKRGDRARDLADLNVYTYYNIERPAGEEDAVTDVYLDGEFYPFERMRLDVDARYNVPDAAIDEFNTRLWLWQDRVWSTSVEQRYAKDRSSLWSGSVEWRANDAWSFESHVRYEAEGDRMEEVGGYVQRTMDCMALRTGAEIRPGYTRTDGTMREDEWRVTIEFWLTAFPSTRMRFR